MRLLPKSEIQKLKQAEQKQAVDEGVKLAKRVDRLREVASIEEQNLESFRVNALSRIQSEIVELTTTKGILETEVKDLEERKQLALEPLDAEWQRLTAFEADLTEKEGIIVAKNDHLEQITATIEASQKDLDSKTVRVNEAIERANQLLVDADLKYTESQRTLNEAIDKKIKIEEELRVKEQNLTNREQGCINRENSIILKEQELEKERNSLLKERVRLEDRAKTLERAFNRLKK